MVLVLLHGNGIACTGASVLHAGMHNAVAVLEMCKTVNCSGEMHFVSAHCDHYIVANAIVWPLSPKWASFAVSVDIKAHQLFSGITTKRTFHMAAYHFHFALVFIHFDGFDFYMDGTLIDEAFAEKGM